MTQETEIPVVDENLRLVLSKGHDNWLADELAKARGRFAAALFWGAVALLMIPVSSVLTGALPPAGVLLLVLSLFVLGFALREIVVSVRRIRKVSGYTAGHKDFLKKYNRA